MKKMTKLSLLAAVAASPLALCGADYSWTFPATDANWGAAENWNPQHIPNAVDANVLFDLGSGSSSVLTFDGIYTVGNLRFNSSGGRTLSIMTPNVNGNYSLDITDTLSKSNNSNTLQFHNENSGRNLNLRVNNLSYTGNGGGSFSFGRTDGGRTISSLAINNVSLGSGSILLNVASDYSLGKVTFVGDADKTIYLTNSGNNTLQTRVATVTGLTQTTGTNATIYGSRREGVAGQKNVATLRIAIENGESFTASTALGDGEGGVLNVLKTGGGTQLLGGTHSYSGSTVIEEGKLGLLSDFTGTGGLDVYNDATLAIHSAVGFGNVRLEGGSILEFNLNADTVLFAIGNGLSRLGVGTEGFVINFDNSGVVGQNYDGIISLVGSNDFEHSIIRFINFGSESISGELTFDQLVNGFSVAIPEPSSYGIAGVVTVLIVLCRVLRRRARG